MSRKHNTKHNRGASNYPKKPKANPYPDHRLSDGKPTSANRGGSGGGKKDNGSR